MSSDSTDDIEVSFSFFGLENTASLAVTREAYRRYVKEFHPDVFPKDSPEQKMATEKLIAANGHKEKLEKYFEARSTEEPTYEKQSTQEPLGDDDWEAWEKARHKAFDDELKIWIEHQASMEQQKAHGREYFRRKKLIRNFRVVVALITVSMWFGWFSENAKLHERKNYEEERQRESAQNQHPQPGYIDPLSGQNVDQMWRDKVDKLRQEQGFTNPEDELKEMPGKIVLLLLWTGGVVWLLLSSRGKGLFDKYLAGADDEKPARQAPWAILAVVVWPLIGTAVWFICGNANTGFFAACIGAFAVWMVGRDKAQSVEAALEDPPARLFAASDFDVMAAVKETLEDNIGDKWWRRLSFDETADEEGFFKAKYVMNYREGLNTNPPTVLERQLILKVKIQKVAAQTSVKLAYDVASEEIRWTANQILENTTARIWQRLERL